jgi:hypothetical protein
VEEVVEEEEARMRLAGPAGNDAEVEGNDGNIRVLAGMLRHQVNWLNFGLASA